MGRGGGGGGWVGVSGFKAPLTASFLFIHAPPAPCAMAPSRYTMSSSATAPSPAPRDASSHVCGEWNQPSPVWTHYHLQREPPPFKNNPVRRRQAASFKSSGWKSANGPSDRAGQHKELNPLSILSWFRANLRNFGTQTM